MESSKKPSHHCFSRILHSVPSRFLVSVLAVVCVPLVWRHGRSQLDRPLYPSVGGFVHPDFEDVRKAYRENIQTGFDKGSAFSVYYKGEPLVDLWGGRADQLTGKAWEKDTLTQAWSVTKGVTALAMGLLVERRQLDFDKPVVTYWPEFRQNDKENITVAMLLSHQAGLSNLQRPISLIEYRDNWAFVEDLLAKQKPLWLPGSKYNYHAFTYGMYADALVRKIDEKHRNISQYFKEEIADPFNFDFHIGLPKALCPRSTIATYTSFLWLHVQYMTRPENWLTLPYIVFNSQLLYDSMQAVDIVQDFDLMNRKELKEIGLSSSNGFGTARSLAQLFDYVANDGTVKGKSLMTPEIVSVLATPLTKDIPVILAPTFPYSPLGTLIIPNRHGQPTIGHRGYGGQNAYGDLQYQVGVAYLTSSNHGTGDVEDPRLANVLDALYRCLHTFKHKHNKAL